MGKAIFFQLILIFGFSASVCHAQQAGDFKIKYGFNAKDRPRHKEEGRPSQKGSFSFYINVHPRVSIGLDTDTFVSKKRSDGTRVTGYGNTTLNFSADLITEEEGESHPSLSFSYSVKLPTGSQSKGLGSGRVDHEYVAAIGKTLSRRTSFEVDLGGYSAGNTDRRGFTTTGEMALMLDHILGSLETKKYKLHNEIDLSTRARDTQSEIFSLHWVTFKLSKHFSLRTGVRAGITPNSPRIGGFGTIIYTGSFRK